MSETDGKVVEEGKLAAGEEAGSKSSEDGEAEKPLLAAVDEMTRLHDYWFPADAGEKALKLDTLRAVVSSGADAIEGGSGAERALVAYLQGAVADSTGGYSEEAERLLSKAVKLHACSRYWAALGTCFWKKGELAQARRCLERAGEDRVAMRLLSMLLRSLPAEAEERKTNTAEALRLAKAAVALDVTDGECWYNAGNAYMIHYFAGEHREELLAKAEAAYAKAEETEVGRTIPDLPFNRARMRKYEENYMAAADDLRSAGRLDASLPWADELDRLDRRVLRTADMLARRGGVKPKKLAAMGAELAELVVDTGDYTRVSLSMLTDGRNSGRAVVLKMLLPVAVSAEEPPATCLMMDDELSIIVVSIYHLPARLWERVSARDVYCVQQPEVVTVNYVSATGKEVSYKQLTVRHPWHFLRNGHPTAKKFAHAELRTEVRD